MSPEKLNDPETYVHHTAGNPHPNWAPEVAMRELQSFSHNKGYATVAYDVVCHMGSDGVFTIMEGRGAGRSAATMDRNEEGEAICMMGYFHPGNKLSDRPQPREIEGLAWGIAWMVEQGWSARDTKILGHRDYPAHLNATTCTRMVSAQWLSLAFILSRNPLELTTTVSLSIVVTCSTG